MLINYIMKHILNKIQKLAKTSLSFLDNEYARTVLIIAVILYSAGVVPTLNRTASSILDNTFAKLLMLVVILYVSSKDTTLALMLTVGFLLTLQINARNNINSAVMEGFEHSKKENKENKEQMKDEDKEEMSNLEEPTGANTPDSCLESGATCSGNLSAPCTGLQTWGAENNAQGLSCGTVRGFSNNDYHQGAPY